MMNLRLKFLILPTAILVGCGGSIDSNQSATETGDHQLELGIKWLPMCERLPVGLDAEVVARTQCGIVTVPLDHLNPSLGTLSLDITRIVARQPQKHEGAIFTNPGGPGSDFSDVFAVNLALMWKRYIDKPEGETYRHLTDSYDVIGITPRGMGSTTDSQLVCQSDEQIIAQNDITEDRTPTNLAAIHHNAGALARSCSTQRLAPYINTDQTARDMEFVRAQLNESKLNYLGTSYGTWLGAWYAGLFPKQVGRMVLDSNVDWTSPFQNASLSLAPEKERIFGRFIAEHAANSPQKYQMGNDPKAIRDIFLQLLPKVRAALRSDNDYYRSPEYLMAAHTLSDWLRVSPNIGDAALREKAQAHRFSPDTEVNVSAKRAFMTLLAVTSQPAPWNDIPLGLLKLTPAISVRTTILCNDSPSSDETFWTGKENQYATQYPVGGSNFHARHCAQWPGKQQSGVPLRNLTQVDSIVMVQAEYDDQTPKTGAFNAFSSLPNTHMVLLKDAYRHNVFSSLNLDPGACVNRNVGEYLAYGRKPERLTTCNLSDQ
ncbi:alpha/beta fold hydrolase [Burkholderia pyrrocinia]